ncbi:MAG TPA: 16S rRNA (guanine(527)-N(7))-methyltransferase RsmG [Solirubrobacteraceae bacterium]|nr:16S rRNA (guanine(527)-N(7))-methyltransferase RsmG [Solirubrobacteraceae bacterium]
MREDAARRLDELVREHGLDGDVAAKLAALLDALATHPLAATAVRDSVRAVDVHIADSLAALSLAGVRHARSVVDIGSGAGIPGLPLAAAIRGARTILVESHFHKCTFLEATARRMGLENVEVACARVEEWEVPEGGIDVALARAVGPQPVVLEYAAPLLREGGLLVDWRGVRLADEEASSSRAGLELGLEPREIRSVEPFSGARDHHLHVFEKVRPTPNRFPRRAGAARKRPLG